MQDAGLQEVEMVSFEGYGLAADANSFVRFILQGTGHFQEILEPLPYAERLRLVEELEKVGEVICATTSIDERTWPARGEFVRGLVPKQSI